MFCVIVEFCNDACHLAISGRTYANNFAEYTALCVQSSVAKVIDIFVGTTTFSLE